jgi:hypothetical protein
MLHPRISVPPVPEAIEAVAEGLVRLNEWYFEEACNAGVVVPRLYGGGFVYRREPPGREWWESVADVLGVVAQRGGDCEDLSAYRAAELRVFEGDPDARVKVVKTRRETFHAIVEHGDGTIEDPSRILLALERMRAGVNR